MSCCGWHCHHHPHCGWEPPYSLLVWRTGPPPREGYVRTLEDERDLVERRLWRLERELEELRGARTEVSRA